MPLPTITFSPACPLTAAPGQAFNLSAILTPSRSGGWFDWTFDPAITAPADGPQSVNFVAPSTPGVYSIDARVFWTRPGGYAAPLPGGGNVGGQVDTVESWQNDGSLDLRMVRALPTAFTTAPGIQPFEGYYLQAKRVDNGDIYYAYVVYNGTVWAIQAVDFIGGVSTVRATSAAIVAGNNVELRVVNGGLEIYGPAGLLYSWNDVSFEFRLNYNPFITGITTYPQPTITNNAIAAVPALGQCSMTVPIPAITGPDSALGGTTVQFGNSGASGGTWSATCGTINATTGVWVAPCGLGSCTITYTVGLLSNTKTVTVTAAPAITVLGNYSETSVSATLQMQYPIAGGVWSALGGTVSAGGLFTATAAGTATVTYTPAAGTGCPVSINLTVFPAMAVVEKPNTGCLTVQRGETVAFTLSGGSGFDQWSTNCSGSVSPLGVFVAPNDAVECTVSVLDTHTGQQIDIPICVTGPVGTCVVVTGREASSTSGLLDRCCEYRVACGGVLFLAVPGIGITSVTRKLNAAIPAWNSALLITQSEPFAQLTSQAAGVRAIGNCFTAGDDMRLDVIVTPSMLSAGSITRWGFSISGSPASLIDFSIGVDASGNVGVWQANSLVANFGVAAAGQALSVAYLNGTMHFYKGGIEICTANATNCGNFCIAAEFNSVNVSLGGPASPTWNVLTQGGAALAGLISQNGRFQAPASAGLVELEADVSGWKWRVRARVVQATPRRYDPNDIWRGGGAEVWIGVRYLRYDETPVLALDGSPDAATNPGCIDVGDTRSGFKFSYQREQAEITTDSGAKIITNGTESGILSGDMISVRDLERLRLLLSTATIRTLPGFQVIDIGGKNCICEFSAMLIKPNENLCGSENTGYDILYFPRVASTTKGFEWNFAKAEITSLPFDLTLIPDKTRPRGAQLFSLFFANQCNQDSGTISTCKM